MGFVAALVLIVGCVEANHDDLNHWMENERARHQPKLSAPHVPVGDHASVYTLHEGLEPFSHRRLLHSASAEKTKSVTPSSKSAMPSTPPLEASPLAGMRLVGSFERGGQPVALLRVNGSLYAVRVGDKLGQDQGRVSAITLSELVLREVAIDLGGQSTARVVRLALVSEP
jgi:type IV pilus assembly protein PilP